VASFLGLANFYRRFIHNFSSIAIALTELTKKSKAFVWSPEAQASFEALKSSLCAAPVLAPPDRDRPYTITCDASAFAIGAVLSQGEGDEYRVVAYESRKLQPAERVYLNHDKETLSVIHALKKWRHYIQNGHQTKVITDNAATKCILTKSTEQLNIFTQGSDSAHGVRILSRAKYGSLYRLDFARPETDSLQTILTLCIAAHIARCCIAHC
jgi:hypothetical protein